jgi:hypothetical protein
VELLPFIEYPDTCDKLVIGSQSDSKSFIGNQAKFNNVFVFASFSAGRAEAPPGGPMPVLLNGEFQKRIGSLYPGDDQVPSFDQLYVMDSKMANNQRMNNKEIIEEMPKKMSKFVCDT